MSYHEQLRTGEAHYDAETVQRALALASTLQKRRQELMTAEQVEALGAEVGLDREVVRQALVSVARQPALPVVTRAPRAEFWWMLAALAIPVLFGILAYGLPMLMGETESSSGAQWRSFATLIAPVAIAALQGFVAGRKGSGFAAGTALSIALAPTFWQFVYHGSAEPTAWLATIAYVLFGSPIAGLLGVLGARARERYFPLPKQ